MVPFCEIFEGGLMKITYKIKYTIFLLLSMQTSAYSANLLEVYQQAQISDPIFQQAVANRLATKQGVPISAAALLPNIAVKANPTVARVGYAGTNFQPVFANSGAYINPRNVTERYYTLSLSISQTIFNFSQFSTVAQQWSLSKAADATLNAALEDLMLRVSNAYFAILRDEDNLAYAKASTLAFKQSFDQMNEQYKVGIKTITDVYTAEASYDNAVASQIEAETTLANDKENLRVMTGIFYPHLDKLSEKFPLMTPQPQLVETWVERAIRQNWAIKAAQYQTQAARQNIRVQMGGHFPTVSLQSTFSRQYSHDFDHYPSFAERNGAGTTSTRAIGLNIDLPVFSGGLVHAETKQAMYQYHASRDQLEQTLRNTQNTTRQSFSNVVLGISKVKADLATIKSLESALSGLQESYKIGTETLVNVLDQREKVFLAQTTYATDRYAYVINFLTLKQAAGTLSFDDLCAINQWLQ